MSVDDHQISMSLTERDQGRRILLQDSALGSTAKLASPQVIQYSKVVERTAAPLWQPFLFDYPKTMLGSNRPCAHLDYATNEHYNHIVSLIACVVAPAIREMDADFYPSMGDVFLRGLDQSDKHWPEFYEKLIQVSSSETRGTVTQADIASFYPSVSHRYLFRTLSMLGCPREVNEHLFMLLGNIYPSGYGLPIGFYASDFLARVTLWPVWVWLKKERIEFFAFVDDFRLLSGSNDESPLKKLRLALWEEGLNLRPAKVNRYPARMAKDFSHGFSWTRKVGPYLNEHFDDDILREICQGDPGYLFMSSGRARSHIGGINYEQWYLDLLKWGYEENPHVIGFVLRGLLNEGNTIVGDTLPLALRRMGQAFPSLIETGCALSTNAQLAEHQACVAKQGVAHRLVENTSLMTLSQPEFADVSLFDSYYFGRSTYHRSELRGYYGWRTLATSSAVTDTTDYMALDVPRTQAARVQAIIASKKATQRAKDSFLDRVVHDDPVLLALANDINDSRVA